MPCWASCQASSGLQFSWDLDLSRRDCFLTLAPLSRKGFIVLAVVFVFSLSAILPFGRWTGWNWPKMLVYAPTGGVSQELFFRACLLPALLLALPMRSRVTLPCPPCARLRSPIMCWSSMTIRPRSGRYHDIWRITVSSG